MKKKITLLLLFILTSFSVGAQSPSVSFTSVPTSTAIGTFITINYKYSIASAGKLSCGIALYNDWTWISTVGYSELNPAVAGTDVVGTFSIFIPEITTPTADLTGVQNYKINLELRDSNNNWLIGDYSVQNYNFTAAVTPAVSITSIPTSTQVGNNLVVNYKYTAATAGKVAIGVSKNGGPNAWDYISTVGYLELDPAVAGTDVTGTFTIAIPGDTTPTSALTGNENYRVTLELRDAMNNWLAGDYSTINYNFTASTLSSSDFNLDTNEIFIFPNPVQNVLNLKNADNLTKATFSIFNVLGETMVQSKSLDKNAIDVSNLSAGLYILSINSGERKKLLKFQKK